VVSRFPCAGGGQRGGGEHGGVKPVGDGGYWWLKEEDTGWACVGPQGRVGHILHWAGVARRGGRDGWAASWIGPKVEKE
jgi:hypothetical protein